MEKNVKKMVLFRPHREFLDQAMAEVREVITLEETRPSYGKDSKLTCEWYSFDHRIDWDTYICCEDGNAYGFSNGPLV